MTSYGNLRPYLRTGDVVLFQGHGLVPWLIRTGSGPWTHTGLVWRFRDPADVLCIFESTTRSKIKDTVTGRIKEGPALRLLSEVISGYPGAVAVRRIAGPPWPADRLRRLSEFRRSVYDRRYETSYLNLLRAAWDGVLGANERNLNSLFCSELNAEQHNILGVIDSDTVSSEITPTDYSEQAWSADAIELIGEYSWLPQETIKGTPVGVA